MSNVSQLSKYIFVVYFKIQCIAGSYRAEVANLNEGYILHHMLLLSYAKSLIINSEQWHFFNINVHVI
jgi:hypothetical protein